MLRRVEHNFGKWCHYSHVYWTGHSLVWNFFASNFNLNFMACPSVFLSFNKPCSFAARLIIWLLPFQPFQMLCVLKHVAFGNFNFFHITSRRENFDSLYANTLWWLIERSMAAWLSSTICFISVMMPVKFSFVDWLLCFLFRDSQILGFVLI